ncbi:MAG: peptidoglycan-binding protein LysM, partial [Firmicutes bacterium HGW-Firmicutes-8]
MSILPPCPTGFTTYIIRAGDTFYSLAIRFNTTVAVLLQANPGVNPNALMIGQAICVPV